MHQSYLGLSSSQVENLRKEFGLNVIPSQPGKSPLIVFLSQFKSQLVLLLFVATIFSLIVKEWLDAGLIILIILLNAVIGFAQEVKAKKEIEILKNITVLNTRVIRDGKEILLDSSLLVPGDLIVLSDGDKIPADCEILESRNLTINEASLTGESVPVEKNIKDEIFQSTVILSGRGFAKVISIGEKTKFGQLAKSLSQIEEEKTPLEIQVSSVSQKITIVVISLIVVIALISWLQGQEWADIFLSSVALAVAAIPEGLPAVLTIALAVGVKRLSQKKAIVKRLVATESLGSVDVICTDKTGTLTKNEMTVAKIINLEKEKYNVEGVGYKVIGNIENWQKSPINDKILQCAVLCNSSSLLEVEDGGSHSVLGDTTEGALLILALKAKLDYRIVREENKLEDEIPFDSDRKMMTVLVGKEIFSKGAPERIIEKTNLSDDQKTYFLSEAQSLGEHGYRVLAFATKKFTNKNKDTWEENLEFLGLMAIFDAPRLEVSEALEQCRRAGIDVIMLTGDSPQTARAIGEQIGLLKEGDEIVTGQQLNEFSDEILSSNLSRVRIFARVSPTDKLRIVQALQAQGKVVSVTGDGVNDAAALKKAQVGVAMGLTGTEVAKEAADLVITDDNFATIVAAIEQGRTIYLNLSRAIKYLLACNMGEIFTVLGCLILGFPLVLSPLSILWMNLVTDGLPALALAVDSRHTQVLNKTKQTLGINSGNLLDFKAIKSIGLWSFVLWITALFGFLMTKSLGIEVARITVFSVLVLGQLMLAFVIRGREQNIFANKTLLIAVGIGLVSQLLIIFVEPLRNLFI